MKIAIIAAMDQEVENIKKFMNENFSGYNVHNIGPYTFFTGKIYNHDIILTVGGMGKVQTGMIMATLYSNFNNIDKVINVGVSGGVNKYVDKGEVVVLDHCSFADVDATFDGDVYGQIPRLPRLYNSDREILNIVKEMNDCKVKIGDILTGDKFYISLEETEYITNTYFNDLTVRAFDMETTAFAESCCIYKLPFMAIRAISDVIGVENQHDNYHDYLAEAAKKSNEILINILKLL